MWPRDVSLRAGAVVLLTLALGAIAFAQVQGFGTDPGDVQARRPDPPIPTATLQPGTSGALQLHIELVPHMVLPGEPFAVYTTVTNHEEVPRTAYPVALYYSSAEGKRGGLNPMLDVSPSSVELAPAASVRRKTWIYWYREQAVGFEDQRFASTDTPATAPLAGERPKQSPPQYDFVFPDPGDYSIHASIAQYGADGKVASRTACEAVLRVRAPGAGELQALRLLRAPMPLVPPVRKGKGPFRPSSTVATLNTWSFSEFDAVGRSSVPVREEKGRNLSAVPLARLREIYDRFPGTPYAWYAALALARWESVELRVDTFYQKPSDFARAVELLRSIETRPLPSALREEVLALQAELHFVQGMRAAGEAYLDRIESTELAEPLKSRVERIRRTWSR